MDKEKVLVPELRPPEIVQQLPDGKTDAPSPFGPALGCPAPGEGVDKDCVPGGGPRDSNPDPGIGSESQITLTRRPAPQCDPLAGKRGEQG